MSKEFVILVDEMDNSIGLEEKIKAHGINGKLHRAFTALLFDSTKRLLLTQRDQSKMLWPTYWDGTVASHPRESETYTSSAQRRIPEEIGITCKMNYLFKFEYHVKYKNVGSENEVCGTLMSIIDEKTKFVPVKGETSQIQWITPEHLHQAIQNNPENYCPWMLIALYLLDHSDAKMKTKYHDCLEKWIHPQLQESLKKAINFHLPFDKWRIIHE